MPVLSFPTLLPKKLTKKGHPRLGTEPIVWPEMHRFSSRQKKGESILDITHSQFFLFSEVYTVNFVLEENSVTAARAPVGEL